MIEYVTLETAAPLDAYVAAHPRGHIMQTSLWGRVKEDWGWHGLIFRDRLGQIRGTMALLEHRGRLPGVCLLYAPRGPIFESENAFRVLVAAARNLGQERGAWLLRIDPEISARDARFLDMARGLGFSLNQAEDFSLFQPRLCYVKSLLGEREDTLILSWHRTARTHLRQALRGNLTVRQGTWRDLPAFCAMMEETARRQGFVSRSLPYFRSLLRGLSDHGTLWLAEAEGRPAAGAISAWWGKNAWFLYGCAGEEGRARHGGELLQWSMQCQALKQGCLRYDLRGVEGPATESNPKYGLHRYKQGLGAELQVWVGQLDLRLRPGIAEVYQIASRLHLL